MKSNSGGFTLIELIVVIVILGILAATAVPKFMDMSTDAKKAAGQGYAAAINSACATNFAQVKLGTATITYTGATAVSNGVSISGTIDATTKAAVEATCTGNNATSTPCGCTYS